MKRKLIVCVTNYQVILAVQMKLTIFQDCEVILVIHAGKTRNLDKVFERTKELNIFEKVYYEKNEDIDENKGWLYQSKRFLQMLFGYKGYSCIVKPKIEEMIFYNVTTFVEVLFAEAYKYNPDIVTSRLEEGILSYGNQFSYGMRGKISRKIRSFLGKGNLLAENDDHNYYCTLPELNGTSYRKIEIPAFESALEELRNKLNIVFNYKKANITTKYIFFASTSADNKEMNAKEVDFILKIARRIGVENISVKMHPRDISDIYEKHGIATIKCSDIPWEVFQLNLNKEEHILLTATSGAFLNISTYRNGICGYFLFKLLDNEYQDTLKSYIHQIENIVEELHKINKCKGIIIAGKQNRNEKCVETM